MYRNFIFVIVLFLFCISSLVSFSHSHQQGIPNNTKFSCGTCDYLQEQWQRIKEGKKPIINTEIVPADYFNRPNLFNTNNVNKWPRQYVHIAPDRTDSDGDGLIESRVKIDFNNFLNFGYTQQQVDELIEEQRRCIEIYNNALNHVGLEFLEVTDDSYHVLFQATAGQHVSGSGLATMHGGFGVERDGSNEINYWLNASLNFQAMYEKFENGTISTVFDNPFGDPFLSIFDPSESFVNGTFQNWVGGTMLHEMGHLIGLEHPWTALQNYVNGIGDSYPVDWLSHPVVSNPPPDQFSWIFGGEDFASTNWSRGLYNSFMTYDRPSYSIQFDLPPQIKAFIAHYYGIFGPSSAQVLLDQAIDEFETLSPLAREELAIESEPNNNLVQANPINIGKPILGALSSRSSSEDGFVETYEDVNDSYLFQIATDDIGEIVNIEIGVGSIYYDNTFSFSDDGRQVHGDIAVQVYDPSGSLVIQSSTEEFPSLNFTPAQEGIYTVSIIPSQESNRLVHKDYVLDITFEGGGPPSAPTWTPTPTNTPVDQDTNPTPISVKQDYDLSVERIWISNDNGTEIENPEPGQFIRLNAAVSNVGQFGIDSFQQNYFINGQRIGGNEINQTTPPGGGWNLWWGFSSSFDGVYEYKFELTTANDQNLSNNSKTITFAIGDVAPPTNTPQQPVTTPTFTPTQTPTFTLTPTATNTETPVPNTPTFTPTVTPTLEPTATIEIPSPTPDDSNQRVENFQGNSFEAVGWDFIEGGFTNAAQGEIAFGSLPEGVLTSSEDQMGMEITVQENEDEVKEVVFVYPIQTYFVQARVPVLLELSLQSSGPGASVALVSLKGNLSNFEVDGSIATNIPQKSEIFLDGQQKMYLLYEPDTGTTMTPAIQVASTTGDPTTIWIDYLKATPLEGAIYSSLPNADLNADLTYEFNVNSLDQDEFAEFEGGFSGADPGLISYVDLAPNFISTSDDNRAVKISVDESQVTFLHSKDVFNSNGKSVLMRLTYRTSFPNVAVTLAALRGNFSNFENVDGTIAAHSPASAVNFFGQPRALTVLFDFDINQFTPIIQVAGSGVPCDVFIDSLEIFYDVID